jgi:hypothetical protein
MKFTLALVALLLIPAAAHAFPEMVRKGYANCMTCHYAPSGGGILNEYGRQLSREVLSTAGVEGEEQFLWNLVKLPDKLAIGGDFRPTEVITNTPTEIIGAYYWMQQDIEAAYSIGKFDAVATAGLDYQGSFLSRRHYLTYHATDEIAARAGKFLRQYGINTPDHIIAIKRGIGFDEGTETYNVEASYVDDVNNVFVTGVLGRPDQPSLNADQGVTITASRFFADRYKVGASYGYLTNPFTPRHLAGPWGILGFRENLFLLAEMDFQLISPPGLPAQNGVVDYTRLDYEFVQGMHIFLTQEYILGQFGNDSTESNTYGIGLQFFPRPHFELLAAYDKMRLPGATFFEDYAYLMFHFYL